MSGWKIDSPKYKSTEALFKEIWDSLEVVADVDRDGKITQTEWVGEGCIPPPSFKERALKGKRIFDILPPPLSFSLNMHGTCVWLSKGNMKRCCSLLVGTRGGMLLVLLLRNPPNTGDISFVRTHLCSIFLSLSCQSAEPCCCKCRPTSPPPTHTHTVLAD